MRRNARILVVVAAVSSVLLGTGSLAFAVDSMPSVDRLVATSDGSGPIIHLGASDRLETVYYSPQPGVWVVEMPEATWDSELATLSAPDLGVDRAELVAAEEFGKRISRLTIWLDRPARLDLKTTSEGLELAFIDPATSVELPTQVNAAEEPPLESPSEVRVDSVATLPPVRMAAMPPMSGGTSLLAVAPVSTKHGVVVEFRGDGPLKGSAFALENPARIVVDLPGVVNRSTRQVFSVQASQVDRVRVAQFRATPEPISRVVVDVDSLIQFEFQATETGGILRLGGEAGNIDLPRSLNAHGALPETVDNPVDTHAWSVTPEETEVADGPILITNETVSGSIAITSQSIAGIDSSNEMNHQIPGGSIQVEPLGVQDEFEASPVASSPPETAAYDDFEERSPWVADPSQLIEKAPAAQVIEVQAGGAETYEPTEVESEETEWSGEPISLHLKDADIKDVLRTFSTLTHLNIVLDPTVSGSVTVELHSVPWDQALDLILKINGLDYVLENNVLRVASTTRLAAEKSASSQLEQERERSKPLKTYIKRVSYATAEEVAGLLSGDSMLMSERGSIVVDQRTNSLIIRDVVDRVEGVLRLIENLDQPTPQVVIEGRIVETTRDYSHALGISWGFDGVMDAAHGNATGLTFPNSVEVDGGVELLKAGPGFINFAFGDILNTFNLDFQLRAAERDGIVRIVSTPRVTTQNLQQASIQSGLQIPIQTIANNTVTTQYISATLRLQVTPQITAEGTVMLDLNIQKQEPIIADVVQGATNAPIFTRDAQTMLLVRDGGTTVIAGIYQINDQTAKENVPGLAKIPILGWFFRNKDVFNRHDELLIFVTPRIVKY
ncbi:MAG: type IV pilus secretin PilQ [bacterium]|nr:type IV pilus secretin PilQ [bacterium]